MIGLTGSVILYCGAGLAEASSRISDTDQCRPPKNPALGRERRQRVRNEMAQSVRGTRSAGGCNFDSIHQSAENWDVLIAPSCIPVREGIWLEVNAAI
jgi:hypothetical protein